MKYKVLIFLVLCLGFGDLSARGQTNPRSSSFQSISLRKIGKYAESYPNKMLKIPNVILEDVRGFENDWPHLLQLYDPRTRFRRGAKTINENPCCIREFSIFTDQVIGIPMLKQKDEWVNRRVNVYIQITDRGLTPFTNIGLVMKVELLDAKGKVEKTLPAS